LFTSIMVISVLIILIPNAPLIAITIWSQVLNAMLLPVVLISMMLMVNKNKLMGAYTNNKLQNVIGWSTTVILIALTAMLVLQPLLGALSHLF